MPIVADSRLSSFDFNETKVHGAAGALHLYLLRWS